MAYPLCQVFNETASDEHAVWAQEDMLLRVVRFLDTMIQRDTLQKAAFLKDLGAIWPRVDARVLKFRLIPPLLAEARTEALQPVLLPLLLAMAEKQDDEVGCLCIFLLSLSNLMHDLCLTIPGHHPTSRTVLRTDSQFPLRVSARMCEAAAKMLSCSVGAGLCRGDVPAPGTGVRLSARRRAAAADAAC